jgi:hypothetical protein
MLLGDMVYYDKCGGIHQGVFPFSEPYDQGLGLIVSSIMTYEYHGDDIFWAWILDENGNRIEISLDYLRLVVI